MSDPDLRNSRSKKIRSSKGNMLVLVAAVTVGIILVLLIFALHYTRMLGAQQEQSTAIEAAALKAASDLSLIVVDDPYYGFISLSDYAPVGHQTAGIDNYYTPVQSINTILGTVRLDMIIADQVGDPAMKVMAQNDYNAALIAQQNLYAVLQAAIAPGGTGTDLDGNVVSPYQDAVTAYNSNQVRMTGAPSQLVPNSMKLTLGSIVGAPTCTTVPESPYENATSNDTQTTSNGVCYRAFQDIPYNNNHFVFSGISNSVNLVDPKQFLAAAPAGLAPYTMLSIVKAEADQQFQDSAQNASSVRVVHGVSCAEPASANDPRPAPGALVISSPDGPAPITKFNDILTDPIFAGPPLVFQTPKGGGDYPGPGVVLNPFPITGLGGPYTFTNAGGIGLYDWLRRGGLKVRVTAILGMIADPLIPNGAAGVGYLFLFQKDAAGMFIVPPPTVIPVGPVPVNSIADSQLFGVDTAPFTKNGQGWDTMFLDEVYQQGRTAGGRHAGEPFATPEVDQANLLPPATTFLFNAVNSLLQLLAYVLSLLLNFLTMNPPSVPPHGWLGPGGALEYGLFKRLGTGFGPIGGGGSWLGMQVYQYPSAGATTVRPTYQVNGLDVEYRFRKDEILPVIPPL